MRGVYPSLGAAGALAAGGVVALLVATGMVAFRDWGPDAATAPAGGTLVLRTARQAAPAKLARRGGGRTARAAAATAAGPRARLRPTAGPPPLAPPPPVRAPARPS